MAVDGKTLRGIHVVGQQAVGVKQNELGALPDLLNQLDLRGRVVTGDAQFTQRKECRQIVGKGGTTSSL